MPIRGTVQAYAFKRAMVNQEKQKQAIQFRCNLLRIPKYGFWLVDYEQTYKDEDRAIMRMAFWLIVFAKLGAINDR